MNKQLQKALDLLITKKFFDDQLRYDDYRDDALNDIICNIIGLEEFWLEDVDVYVESKDLWSIEMVGCEEEDRLSVLFFYGKEYDDDTLRELVARCDEMAENAVTALLLYDESAIKSHRTPERGMEAIEYVTSLRMIDANKRVQFIPINCTQTVVTDIMKLIHDLHCKEAKYMYFNALCEQLERLKITPENRQQILDLLEAVCEEEGIDF